MQKDNTSHGGPSGQREWKEKKTAKYIYVSLSEIIIKTYMTELLDNVV